MQFDITTPNAARIYDYYLGGKNHFAADREAARLIDVHLPQAAGAARENRRFLSRVVSCLVQEQGIRQFLDIGSGIPCDPNVHQIAQAGGGACRVAYVDYDAVVLSHARAILEDEPELVRVVPGDLRDPGQVIRDAGRVLDFTQPVAVLLIAVLHFLRDDEGPHRAVQVLKDALVPGSAVAVSHITAEGIEAEQARGAQQVYQGASAPAVPRTRAETKAFLDGLKLVEPRVTDIAKWRPVTPSEVEVPLSFYGGIGVKE